MSKAKTVTTGILEAPKHIYGATGYTWAVGATREEVLKKLAADAGERSIKADLEVNGGLYAWTCIVDLPQSAHYEIRMYQPRGVPTRDVICFRIRNAKGAHVIEEQERPSCYD